MVLSNKKLKQKFRSLLAESIEASESKRSSNDSSKADIHGELQSIKELLSSKSRKNPKSETPRRRRKKRPLREDLKEGKGSDETQKGIDEKTAEEEEEKRKKKTKKNIENENEEGGESKKRKREDAGDQGLVTENKKMMKKKKKKKERKKKEKNKKTEKRSESVEIESDEMKVEEPMKVDESETKKVYVGGIPYYSSEDDIRSFFEGCGTVTEIDCMTFPESGKFRGIAILTFKV